MKPSKVKEVLRKEMELAFSGKDKTCPIYLEGPPGIGKTAIPKQLAVEEFKVPLLDFDLSCMSPEDIRFAGFDPISKRGFFVVPDQIPRTGKGVIFLDEISKAPPPLQAPAWKLVHENLVGDVQVPKEWLIILAGNRLSDRANAFKLAAPLANRCRIIRCEPDGEDACTYYLEHPVDPIADAMVVAYLRHRPNDLYTGPGMMQSKEEEEEEEKQQQQQQQGKRGQPQPQTPSARQKAAERQASDDFAFATPRSWDNVRKVIRYYGIDKEQIEGTIGRGVGRMFSTFAGQQKKCEDAMKLIISGEDHQFDEPSFQLFLSSLFVSEFGREPKKLARRLIEYATFLDGEFAKLLVIDAVKVSGGRNSVILSPSDKDIKEAYLKFSKKHGGII